MKKSLLEIYALSVCLISAVVILSGLLVTIENTAGIIAPTIMMDTFAYRAVATNDAYWQSQRVTNYNSETKSYPPRPTEDQLTTKRLVAFKQADRDEQRIAMQGLIKGLASFLLGVLFFAVHWRIAKRQRERDNHAAA